MTTEVSETGHRYQLMVRGECGPLTEWLFGDVCVPRIPSTALTSEFALPAVRP